MIDLKTAVAAAFREFDEIFGPHVKDPLLESVQPADDGRHWIVTIAFNVLETQPLTPLEEVMAHAKGLQVQERKTMRRKSRAFNVDVESGVVNAFKAVEA